MTEANLSLAPRPESAGVARRFVSETLAGWGHAEATEVATLLVSELVTNALLHARTDLVLNVRRLAGSVRIEVRDGLSRLPARKRYSSDSGTGRGLFLVEELAAAWGAEHLPGGKRVWCEIRLGEQATDDPGSRRSGEAPLAGGRRGSRAPVRGFEGGPAGDLLALVA
jgi:anti-sigma regulatory factor (Ser/Thr protein kinase)